MIGECLVYCLGDHDEVLGRGNSVGELLFFSTIVWKIEWLFSRREDSHMLSLMRETRRDVTGSMLY